MRKEVKGILIMVFIMFCYFVEVNAQRLAETSTQLRLEGDLYPINAMKFEAQRISFTAVNLSWSTSISAYWNDLFYLERSEDGIHWVELGQYQGDGNGETKFDYSFLDDRAINGKKVCYRLKQHDVNGIFEYSQKVEMPYLLSDKSENSEKISSHTIHFTVQALDEIKKMELLDAQGIMLYKETSKKNTLDLKYTNLSKEIYFIKLYLSNQVVVSKVVFN